MAEATKKGPKAKFVSRPRVFRILRGIHSDSDIDNGDGTKSPCIRRKGDVFESVCNLLGHNSPGSRKFELIFDGPMEEYRKRKKRMVLEQEYTPEGSDEEEDSPTEPNSGEAYSKETLNAMTVKELKKFAEEEGISLENTTSKPTIIAAILDALDSGETPEDSGHSDDE